MTNHKNTSRKNLKLPVKAKFSSSSDPKVEEIKEALGIEGPEKNIIYRNLRSSIKLHLESAGIQRKSQASEKEWRDIIEHTLGHAAFAESKKDLFQYDSGNEAGFDRADHNLHLVDLLIQDALKKNREGTNKFQQALCDTVSAEASISALSRGKRSLTGKCIFLILDSS